MATAIDDFSDIREAENMDTLTELFEDAADHVKNLIPNLDQSVILELYSYYKQATEGICNIPQPRFYQTKARAKWDAWHKLGDMSKNEAKEKYVKIITELDPNFNKPNKSESWITVSSLQNTEKELTESEKTVFDYVKDGVLRNLITYVKNNDIKKVITDTDENGLGLIHWAADRGHLDILQYLINLNVNLDMTENDGQSALHYAVSCEHLDCVKLLVQSGAKIDLKDSDGCTPSDLTTDSEFLIALNNQL